MSIFGLSEVTPEVILEICKHLETPKDRLNLVCCSRFFHDLCLPLLYQRLWTGGKDLAPIARVVRTLIEKPALAARVHTLHLFDWETYIGYNFAEFDEALNAFKEDRAMEREQADTNEEANEGDADDQDGVEENRDDDDNASDNGSIYLKRFDYGPLREQAKLVTRSEDETDYWMDEITIGNADAWVALLLTLLPNLQRLEIEFPYGSLWVRWVLKWAIAGRLDSIPAFKSLSEVYVDWDSENVKACCRNIMPFFLLPSMRRLYASKLFDRLGMFEEAWVDRDDLTQVAQFSPVTHIEIDESDGQWGMWKVVGICKNLQSFKYNHSGCVEFDPVTFHEELFPLRETLQTIWLGIQESSHGNCMEVSYHCNNPLPSFKDFTSLKTLRLRAKNLPGLNLKSGSNHASMTFAEAFPSSLETLQIADIGNRVNLRTLVRELQDHIEHALDSTPALREIAVELLLDSPRMPRLLLDLDRACTKVGINFYVCGTHDRRAKWRTEGFTPRVQ